LEKSPRALGLLLDLRSLTDEIGDRAAQGLHKGGRGRTFNLRVRYMMLIEKLLKELGAGRPKKRAK
jgi:hypothetical protein